MYVLRTGDGGPNFPFFHLFMSSCLLAMLNFLWPDIATSFFHTKHKRSWWPIPHNSNVHPSGNLFWMSYHSPSSLLSCLPLYCPIDAAINWFSNRALKLHAFVTIQARLHQVFLFSVWKHFDLLFCIVLFLKGSNCYILLYYIYIYFSIYFCYFIFIIIIIENIYFFFHFIFSFSFFNCLFYLFFILLIFFIYLLLLLFYLFFLSINLKKQWCLY